MNKVSRRSGTSDKLDNNLFTPYESRFKGSEHSSLASLGSLSLSSSLHAVVLPRGHIRLRLNVESLSQLLLAQ